MRKIKKNRSGQVTIFIIIAILIVVALVLIFIVWRRPPSVAPDTTNPYAYIDRCVKDSLGEAIELISEQGGDIEPEGSVMYYGKERTYLCYNMNYYSRCINQRPMLTEHMEEEITKYIRPKVRTCFTSLKQELEDRGYSVSLESMNLSTSLETKKVIVAISRKLSMTKEETKKFSEFEIQLSHPLYELGKVASEIANQESHYCYFETLGFMITYPEYNIEKVVTGNSDTIYTITDIPTNKKFTFAIRSCVMPAGL